MKEEYLHYVFEKRMLGKRFVCTNGNELTIISFGELNVNAGPDFLDAKIEYEGQIWCGAIEFHVKASDWYRHKHQDDPAYNAVIAHFVFEPDRNVKIGDFELPMVNIEPFIDPVHYQYYLNLVNSKSEILCQPHLSLVPENILEEQKLASLEGRLRQKSKEILNDIEMFNGDFYMAYLLLLARCFGGKVNQTPFGEVAMKIKRSWFAKLNYDSFKIEALFLGIGGFLEGNESKDQYISQLQDEFKYLKQLFEINDFIVGGWKYSRMRPHNFPDRRLVQFALYANELAKIGWNHSRKNKTAHFAKTIQLGDFWKKHYRINQETGSTINGKLSKKLIDLIWINVEIPFEFAKFFLEGNQDQQDKILYQLKLIAPEQNRIIDEWRLSDIKIDSAYDTQALIGLKKQSCIRKKCLFCAIGKSLLTK